MTSQTTSYHCDKCGKKLRTCDNSLEIVTSVSESLCWSRLSVKIEYSHGVHNDGTTEQADLCKPCAVALLADALKRVKSGERMTAGVDSSDQENWGR